MRFLSGLTPLQTQYFWLALLVCCTAVVIAADVAVVEGFGVEHSLSWLCRRIFTRYITVAFAFVFWLGILFGHWFPPG